jgi:hypothetical protein
MGNVITIGNDKVLYNATYPKYREALDKGLLEHIPGNLYPEEYVNPGNRYLFRFPFPDEAEQRLGRFRETQRSFPLVVEGLGGDLVPVKLAYQLIDHIDRDGFYHLSSVLQEQYTGRLFHPLGKDGVQWLVGEIQARNVNGCIDPRHRQLLQAIAGQIMKDYGIREKQPVLRQEHAVRRKRKGI